MQSSLQSQLLKERQVEVKRDGVPVVFHRGTHEGYCFFLMAPGDVGRVSEWLGARNSLNIYSPTGWKQLFVVGKSGCQVVGDRLYVSSSHPDYLLCDREGYILAKNNATIEILKDALEGSPQADP